MAQDGTLRLAGDSVRSVTPQTQTGVPTLRAKMHRRHPGAGGDPSQVWAPALGVEARGPLTP